MELMTMIDSDRALKFRPKGYNSKVWQHLWNEALEDQKWAYETLKNGKEFVSKASNASIKMLGEYLSKNTIELTKDAYDYFKMRSHGYTFLGALDQTHYDKWTEITGRKPSKAKMWKYDHTINKTSAKIVDGKCV